MERAMKREVHCCKLRRGKSYDDTCVICLESLSDNKRCITTVCDHVMHKDCWDAYKRHGTVTPTPSTEHRALPFTLAQDNVREQAEITARKKSGDKRRKKVNE
eukprot:4673959-Prymnesium_polylepis.1